MVGWVTPKMTVDVRIFFCLIHQTYLYLGTNTKTIMMMQLTWDHHTNMVGMMVPATYGAIISAASARSVALLAANCPINGRSPEKQINHV